MGLSYYKGKLIECVFTEVLSSVHQLQLDACNSAVIRPSTCTSTLSMSLDDAAIHLVECIKDLSIEDVCDSPLFLNRKDIYMQLKMHSAKFSTRYLVVLPIT